MLYHISPTPGITVLMPRVSTHGKAYVYALDDLVTGLLFGAHHDDFDFMLDVTVDGIPEIFECYPGAVQRIYEGKCCSVYELPEEGFLRGMTAWDPELVCESTVQVHSETVVPDIYARLLQEERNNSLIIHRFTDRPEYKKHISEHIVDRLIRFDILNRAEGDIRFQTYFRSIIEALQSVMDGHLL